MMSRLHGKGTHMNQPAQQPSFPDEVRATTDAVRLQQLQVIWTHEVYKKTASISAWVTFMGVLTLLALLGAAVAILSRLTG
jgi:hypothetical protein